MSADDAVRDDQIVALEREFYALNADLAERFEVVWARADELAGAKGPAPQWMIDEAKAYNADQKRAFDLAVRIDELKSGTQR